jgi:hypothetical protein
LSGEEEHLGGCDLRNGNLFVPSLTMPTNPLRLQDRNKPLRRLATRLHAVDEMLRCDLRAEQHRSREVDDDDNDDYYNDNDNEESKEEEAAMWRTHRRAQRVAALVLFADCAVEQAFRRFLAELLLVPLPQCLQVFPESATLSCDVQQLLSALLGQQQQWGALSFEAFLARYNEETSCSPSLALALYAEFFAAMSPAFVDLLRRLGRVVVNGRF